MTMPPAYDEELARGEEIARERWEALLDRAEEALTEDGQPAPTEAEVEAEAERLACVGEGD